MQDMDPHVSPLFFLSFLPLLSRVAVSPYPPPSMAAASLSSPSTFLLSTPTPRLLPNSRLTPRVNPNPKTKKPPPLSCTATTAAAASAGSWRDLCSLNSWVVRDYGRLVAAVNALEPQLRRLSDEQVACGAETPPKFLVPDGFFMWLMG